MRPPPHYSVSPFYGFVTTPIDRAPSFAEMLTTIWRWRRGTKPTMRERQLEAAAVERLAAEMGDQAEPPAHAGGEPRGERRRSRSRR
jgi:hypothetical protein